MISAEYIRKNISKVPLLSPAARKLTMILGDPDHSLRDVSKLVEMDPNLTIQVLKTANSALFARRQPMHSVQQAVMRLGEEAIFSVALRSCAGEMMLGALEGYIAEKNCLWSHSIYTALAARALARTQPGLAPDLAYTAGLLHDIGKAILSSYLREESAEVARRCANPMDHAFTEIEEELIGMDHAEAGSILAGHWFLPDTICEAIRLHHNPVAAGKGQRQLVETIHIADALALMAGFTTGADNMNYRLQIDSLKYYAFDNLELDQLVSNVQEEFFTIGEALIE